MFGQVVVIVYSYITSLLIKFMFLLSYLSHLVFKVDCHCAIAFWVSFDNIKGVENKLGDKIIAKFKLNHVLFALIPAFWLSYKLGCDIGTTTF